MATFPEHRQQIAHILAAWGMGPANVAIAADVLSWADLHGIDSHGISMLTDYADLRRRGRIDPRAEPSILKETAVSALSTAAAGSATFPPTSPCGPRSARPNAPASALRRCAIRRISAPAATTAAWQRMPA
jgi:LDH2 family malate/lactate/ureidoglycolate dehydrogenase